MTENLTVTGNGWTATQIKAYIEALLAEKDRALEMADDEREKAAAALRNEQQRATDQAARERDKAAENLRVELLRSQSEGDERLREHISNQVMQIQAALVSADKLETERINRIDARVHGLEANLDLLRKSGIVAQEKFEATVTARFSAVNEFRAALDDLGKQMATRRELEQTKATSNERYDDLLRQFGDMRSRLDKGPEGLTALTARADVGTGTELGAQKFRTNLFAGLGALATVIAVVVAANTYTGHNDAPAVTTVTVTVPAK